MSFSSRFLDSTARVEAQPEAVVKPRYRILIVDDEPNVLKALQRVFRQENYDVILANSAAQALAQLAQKPAQVVISDFMMPEMNGGELLKRVKARYPETIRIMLTGHADTDAVMMAVNEGAVYKFILKPWHDDDLRVTVSLALEQFDLAQRNQELQTHMQQQKRQISNLSRLAVNNRSQLATFLHKKQLLNDAQVQALHQWQQQHKQPMLRRLLEKQWVPEAQIRKLLGKELLIEEVALAEFQVDQAVSELVPSSFCQRQWVVPLKLQGMRLVIAAADPLDNGLLEDLRFITGMQVEVVMAPVAQIEAKINALYGEAGVSFRDLETMVSTVDPFETIEVVIDDDDDASLEELLRSSEEPPAVRLVNAIIIEAVRLGVSDIHVQPRAKSVVVRYRIDGILLDKIQVPLHLLPPLVSRIKVMASLDISERRHPQDGRITVKTPLRIVDLRISTLPTINGEKVVMRILDRSASIYQLDQLGFTEQQRQQVERMVNQPQGIILATGPTGSGKTTTLYSLLQHTATPSKNFITIEDPVEYYLDQAGQVNVHEKIKLSFAQVLRAILRQDPDVVLLGEVRDFETAEVAFHAAMTGHLVYSTLHTNSAMATIARLYDLGLKPYVIASALTGVLAQRLLRMLCPHCKTLMNGEQLAAAVDALGVAAEQFGTAVYRPVGCDRCTNSGYKGRVPIYEVLSMTDQLRRTIHAVQSHNDLDALQGDLGSATLLQSAIARVVSGETSVDEIFRVLGPQSSG
ncbi:MAG TPA: ATPase, T2SS/T4P/T4SS family [Motiliproteus sp.]